MDEDANNDNVIFRALADPTRRIIIDDLNQKDGQSLYEICTRLSQIHNAHMARQSITKHLGVLEAAGILRVEWKGRTKVHFLDVEPIQRIGHTWLNKYL
jgi:DNA-binding transcriptional ArsR family regulator